MAECGRPPDGWHCTRGPYHDGPCAAVPEFKAQERPEIPEEARKAALDAFNASPNTGFQRCFDAALDAAYPYLQSAIMESYHEGEWLRRSNVLDTLENWTCKSFVPPSPSHPSQPEETP